jgi:hypothetical protein
MAGYKLREVVDLRFLVDEDGFIHEVRCATTYGGYTMFIIEVIAVDILADGTVQSSWNA